MRSQEIITKFVNFYSGQGCQLLQRASLLDLSIPMSFVMSAGLVQVENSLGEYKEEGGKYTLVQDCFRHFDIDKVGGDPIHLSFFKMPGAFVFGKINAEIVVRLMWTLAVDILNLAPEKLWATYFVGGNVLGGQQPKDTEAYLGWQKTGLSENRIVGLGPDNNFWIQKNGFQSNNLIRKCGPNTELFFDLGQKLSCGSTCKPGCGCGRFVEFSNSLFINYEINEYENSIREIEMPFTETVIGVERVEMVQEDLISVFETSSYSPLIQFIKTYLSKTMPYQNNFDPSLMVVADHLRALYYLVADGAPPPGKNGRQRIIRKLIRNIITQEMMLEIDSDDFISMALENITIDSLNEELMVQEAKAKIILYFQLEHNRYRKTIERAIKQINKYKIQNVGNALTSTQLHELREFWGIPNALSRKIFQTEKPEQSTFFRVHYL